MVITSILYIFIFLKPFRCFNNVFKNQRILSKYLYTPKYTSPIGGTFTSFKNRNQIDQNYFRTNREFFRFSQSIIPSATITNERCNKL